MLSARLGLLDQALRLFVATLAAQLAQLRQPRGKEFDTLIRNLHAPTLGNWSRAAAEMATLLSARTDDLAPGMQALVGFLQNREQRALLGDFETPRVAGATSLRELVEKRNQLFHDPLSPIPDEATARRVLEETRPMFEHLEQGLAAFRGLPLCWVRSTRRLLGGGIEIELLRFSGREPQPVGNGLVLPALDVPDCEPFLLLGGTGEVLLLSPFVTVVEANGEPKARMIHHRSGRRLLYTDLDGGQHELETRNVDGFRDLESGYGPESLARPKLPAELVAAVVDAQDGTAFPDVPGFTFVGRLAERGGLRTWQAVTQEGDAVVVKTLRNDLADDDYHYERRRLLREAELLLRLRQSSVVDLVGRLEAPSPALVLEYVEGVTLRSKMDAAAGERASDEATLGPARRRLSREHAVRHTEQLLDALAAIHDRAVILRDLRPETVMIDANGSVRLLDVGLAQRTSDDPDEVDLEGVRGGDYVAPEQARPGTRVTPAADIYAVGRLLTAMLTGTPIPDEATFAALPPGLQAVVRRATAAVPNNRYQSADEMRVALSAREGVEWEGSPVEPGECLADSYVLQAQRDGRPHGIYVFDGLEVATDAPVAIAVASRSAEGTRLLTAAVRSLPSDLRADLGHPRLLATRDGLHFAVFDADDPVAALERMLLRSVPAAEPIGPRRSWTPLREPERRLSLKPWLVPLHDRLTRLVRRLNHEGESAARQALLDVIELAEVSLGVIRLQHEALLKHPMSPSVIPRPRSLGRLLADPRLVRALEQEGGDLAPALDDAIRLKLRLQLKDEPVSRERLERCFDAVDRAIKLAASDARDLTPSQLEPILQGSGDRWHYLTPRGLDFVLAPLDSIGKAEKAPPELLAWCTRGVVNDPEERSRREREVTEQRLRKLPGIGRVNRRRARGDFLLLDRAGGPLAVVVCESDRNRCRSVAELEDLVEPDTGCSVIQVLGWVWRVFLRNASGSLEPGSGVEALLATEVAPDSPVPPGFRDVLQWVGPPLGDEINGLLQTQLWYALSEIARHLAQGAQPDALQHLCGLLSDPGLSLQYAPPETGDCVQADATAEEASGSLLVSRPGQTDDGLRLVLQRHAASGRLRVYRQDQFSS